MKSLIPLQAYFLKRRRIMSNYTLRELSNLLKLDNGYLSKVESNKLEPIERNVNRLLYFYKIKKYHYTALNFSGEYIDYVMNKLYYMNFSGSDLSLLNDYLQKNINSIYVGHLYFLLWCYKALSVIWDEEFRIDLNILSNLYTSLSRDEQSFFIICKLFYLARSREFDEAKECLNTLDNLNVTTFYGLNLYVRVCYNFYFNNLLDLPSSIQLCKNKLTEDNNSKRYNNILMYEALYNKKIGNQSVALDQYDTLQKKYLRKDDYVNYGIIQHNLGSLLTSQRKYSDAIIHYELAVKTCCENDTFFELAWCYYCDKQYDKCLKTIQLANKVITKYDVYTLLLNWLLIILDNPCSKRAIGILLKVKKEYFEWIGHDTKNFVLVALANSYNQIGEIQTAYSYLREVLNLQNSYLIEIK